MVDLSEYKELYIKTAGDLLSQLQLDFPLFIKNQLDNSLIEKLHRNAHSLKSQSLVMGFESTGLLCKELEFIFRKVKDEHIVIDGKRSETIADVFKKLYDSLENIKNTNKELNLSDELLLLKNTGGITS